MSRMQYVAFFFLLYKYTNCDENIFLDGEWKLKDASTNDQSEYSATVPGGIYTDLMKNNVIGDVFYGYNDTATRWVARRNWTYYRQFTISTNQFLSYNQINIVFNGLDTFSTIRINGHLIGTTENMFLRYIFNIKPFLILDANTIEVQFTSPIFAALNLTAAQDYLIPPLCPSAKYHGECFANQIRKMQASFAWDWGPALPSMGIWKSVFVEGFNSTKIRHLVISLKESTNAWSITVSTYLTADSKPQGQLVHRLVTDVATIELMQDLAASNARNIDNELKVDFTFIVAKAAVRNWYPNGYGEQPLYNFTTTYRFDDEVDEKRTRIGFRSVQLVQDQLEHGLSFYFRVNDVPIFAKGSNEIPISILPERGQDWGKVRQVLESAKMANMNMLRVWGGGVYESDYFYDLADEFGIMIWQDFMFACAMYPTYPQFLENVKQEVKYQLKRLSTHPSIVLWAGNNENEAALAENWYATNKNYTLYKSDYLKLYVDVIRPIVAAFSPNLIFLLSSPSNGKHSEKEGYVSANPKNPLFGDVHFYNLFANSLSESTYPVLRFASEYGYQSLPDLNAWATVTANAADLQPNGLFIEHRQHHPLGHLQNFLLIEYQLKMNTTSPNYYQSYIFYSQIVQAMSIKFESEFYRSFMGRLDELGRGNTMGALYWQLNDVWVAPSWSGIDATGRWKMLHYFACEFFAPTIITGRISAGRELSVFVVSDRPSLMESVLPALVAVEIYRWGDFQPVDTLYKNVTIDFGRSQQVLTIDDVDAYLAYLGCGSYAKAKTNCFFYLKLVEGSLLLAPNNFVLPNPMKYSNIEAGSVQISDVKTMGERTFLIGVSTSKISLFVWLDSHKVRGRFSENGFLQVTPAKNVTFTADQATTLADLRQALTITHLKDNLYD